MSYADHLSRLALILLVSSGLAATASAQSQPTKGEQALKYRKSLYQVIAWNVGPMGAMAQGKTAFDAAEFARRAQAVAFLTPMLPEGYPEESRNVEGTKLKPAMWQNRGDFDAKLKDLIDRSAALSKVAGGGDEAASKQAFFDMANACKACHDKYKAD
ncbi:MAG TPA: cytochrome c [Steroidobacteraceae bacterium]|nr:cytochrome c [Steroidobacteraceae bacterium]